MSGHYGKGIKSTTSGNSTTSAVAAACLGEPERISHGCKEGPVRLHKPRLPTRGSTEEHKRGGEIVGFASGVARRLRREIGGCYRALWLDLGAPFPPQFLTHTSPGDLAGWTVEYNNGAMRRALDLVIRRVRYQHPDVWGWIVVEVHRDGRLHFHWLVKLPFLKNRRDTSGLLLFRDWLEAEFVRLVGAPEGSHTAAQNMVGAYHHAVSEYLSKDLTKPVQKGLAEAAQAEGVHGGKAWVRRINGDAIKAHYYEERTKPDLERMELALWLRWRPIAERLHAEGDKDALQPWRVPTTFPTAQSEAYHLRKADRFLQSQRRLSNGSEKAA